MKRLLFLFALLTATHVQAQDLVITGIIDGGLAGGLPKGLELYVVNDIADLSVYDLRNATNGNANFGGPTALSGTAKRGTYLYFATEVPNFTSYFGLAPNFTGSVLNVNGDDVVGLFQGGALIDVFGVLGTDGTGEPWDYLDGWAVRVPGTTASATFTVANFTYSGIDVTDNTTTAAQAGYPARSYAPAQTLAPSAGYRLLAPPVTNITVGTLAGINLVQAVAGQYPMFAFPNLFTSYAGTGGYQNTGYIAATSVSQTLEPGRGFLWYLFNQDLTPDQTAAGGGTSRSYLLANRPLASVGPVTMADVSVTFAAVPDGNVMAGNPFGRAMTADGITATAGGPLTSTVQVLLPNGSFSGLPRTAATTLSTWQGFFVEQVTPGAAVTLTYSAATRQIGGGAVVGRTASQQVALTLSGTTAEGATVDEAAVVRVTLDATATFDVDDASKLVPPTGVRALVAPVGERAGAAYRQSILSLPAGDAVVSLAFTTTHAGTFTLTGEALGLPAGTVATLRDVVTGAVADVATGLPFTSDVTDWTNRFELAIAGRTTAGEEAATGVALGALYPNPAIGRAALDLRVDAPQTVRATVVDALGRTVATVFEGALSAGQSQTLAVETAGLAPGVYAVRVTGATFTETRRLVVAR